MGAISSAASGISSLASTLGVVNQAIGAVQTFAGRTTAVRNQEREQALALEQLQQKQQQQESQQAQQTALERQRLAVQSQQESEQRAAALRRAVARQRAQFGASGVSSGAGSSQAVLLGLFDESDEERQRREELDNLRSRALELDTSNAQSVNVLQREQLQQRQALERNLSTYRTLF